MRRISRIYANELIIIAGFIGVLSVSYLYGSLNISDKSLFLNAVLPSAFVDIISIVISTILITKLIEDKRIYERKSKMYEIVNIPHYRMVHRIVWDYKYIITAKPNMKFQKALREDIDITDIKKYFEENVKENFQKDEIIIDEIINITDDEGNNNDVENSSIHSRVQLMEVYQTQTIEILNDFIKEYSYVSTSDYLALLVELKECLRGENPLWIYYFDEGLAPSILEVDKYIDSNQRYLDKVVKLKDYFIGIKLESDNINNAYKSEWLLISLAIILGIIVIVFMKVTGFFLNL